MTDTDRPRRRSTSGGNESSARPVTDLAPPPAGPPPGVRPARWSLPAVVLPRDENTQRVQSAEVDAWWHTLPLDTRLAFRIALTGLEDQ